MRARAVLTVIATFAAMGAAMSGAAGFEGADLDSGGDDRRGHDPGAPGTRAQTQVHAQLCDQRAKVLGHLAQKYKEAPIAVGVTSSGGIVEVLTTDDGQTWTIIVSDPKGTSCLIASGEGWRTLPFDNRAVDPQV